MNDFRLDRGYITVIVGTAPASDRADGKFVQLVTENEAFENATTLGLTPEEAMLVAEALWNRAVQAMKDRADPPQWKALRQTKEMTGTGRKPISNDLGVGVAA